MFTVCTLPLKHVLIKCNIGISDHVNSSVGLKQGCLASPILFSIFIDELITYFNRNDVKGIQIHPDTIQFFALMFADDIALISDTVRGLQMQLNLLYSFADEYKLTVNEQNTKIVVFKNGGTLARTERWHYSNTPLEVVNKFCYGLTFQDKCLLMYLFLNYVLKVNTCVFLY